jgi:hypothetical protein
LCGDAVKEYNMADIRMKWNYNPDTEILTVLNGEVELSSYDLTRITDEDVVKKCHMNGVKSKISDKTASMKDYTLEEKVAVMNGKFEDLVNGTWNMKGTGVKISAKKIMTEAQRMLDQGLISQEAFDILKSA